MSGSEYEKSADYVIVGAGSAGCVIASRLAQNGNSVIVLEAGPDTGLDSTDPLTQIDKNNINVPLLFPNLWKRFLVEQNSLQCGKWHASQTLLPFVSTDQNGVYYPVPRACGAGGCASHHAMQDGVGSLQVYNNIAKVVEDSSWSGRNVKKYFKKMEKLTYETPDCEKCCGKDGWLSVSHTVMDPLSADVAAAIVNQIGVPFRENWCDPQKCFGVGRTDTQIKLATDQSPLGGRSYVYQDLLIPVRDSTNLIHVEFNTLVFDIILKKKCNNKCDKRKKNKYVAKGVKAYNKAYLQEFEQGRAWRIEDVNGDCTAFNADNSLPIKYTRYIAKKEVILSAGTFQSPQLLQLSGIGPKEHLKSLGIPVKLDRPGVGSNLLDHCEIAMAYEVDTRKYLPSWQAGILASVYGEEFYLANYPDYYNNVILPSIQNNPNTLDANTAQIVWDWWSSGSKEEVPCEEFPFPDVHVVPYETYLLDLDTTQDTPKYPGSYFNFDRTNLRPNPANPFDQNGLPDRFQVNNAQFLPAPEAGLKSYLTFLVENLKPGITKGTVRLKSRDPRDAPIIKEDLYKDLPGLHRMAKMVLQIRKLFSDNPQLQTKYGFIKEFQPGPVAKTEDDIVKYIQLWTSYGHHMSGTCAMGAVDKCGRRKDKHTVLDSKCRVIGVDKLRVADCSVYVTPWLHAYNTSRAAYVVGELVSDFIIKENGKCCKKALPKSLPKALPKSLPKSLPEKDNKVLEHKKLLNCCAKLLSNKH